MALESRLRQGLRTASRRVPDAPRPGQVDVVVERGRRRRLVRRLRAALVIVAVCAAAVAMAPKIVDQIERWSRPLPATPPAPGQAIITTIAGNGTLAPHRDGALATRNGVEYPVDLDFDGDGNLYILEHVYPQRVTKLDASGRTTTVVGPGAPGRAGRLELATTFGATALAVDAGGNVYVGGGGGGFIEDRVIRVEPSGAVTTVAGTGRPGTSGDGGPATEAQLEGIWDIDIDAAGNLYIAGRDRIRKVDPDGTITTIVGGGRRMSPAEPDRAASASVHRVTGVTVDAVGNVYFIEISGDRIRRIHPNGVLTTIAGGDGAHGCSGHPEGLGDGSPAIAAGFCAPEHLAVDALGDVFVADTYNDRIRMIGADGIIRTIAGNGTQGFSGDGASAVRAQLSEPSGVAVASNGNVYIADSGNNRVRLVTRGA